MESKRKILNRHRRGDSINSISKDFSISRNTVRSIIRTEGSPSASYERKTQTHRALGPHIETLEKLLRDNKTARPKRTTKHLFEELETRGYKGSYSAVGRYVSQWKKKTDIVGAAACIPLYFPPGDAYQFDWSTDKIILDGEIITVKVAHFILCYSRKRFVYVYFNETQEMVFDAHVRAFEFFGGTPLRGIYDNMKTAVQKVLVGREREWNARFERLCAHYRVEPVACTPARGNEKGRVERQVAIDRQQFFTPMPEAKTLSEVNDTLMSRVITYNKNHLHPEEKDQTIDAIFEKERPCLLPAPLMFEGYKQIDVKVSITCLAQYDRNQYSVHHSCAKKIIQIKAYADQLVFIHEGREVGRHQRRFTTGQAYYDLNHYFPILKRKPGALRNGAPFVNMELPDDLTKVRKHLKPLTNGERDFAHILSYIPQESLENVVSACSEALKNKTISKDVIINILLRKQDEGTEKEGVINSYPPLKWAPQANLKLYDLLLSEAL